jgi:peptidyl-prolyl cis-trans isomerase C
MKQHIVLCALLVGATLLAACGKKDAAAPTAESTTVAPVATVDGKPISKELFEFYVKNVIRRPLAELTPEQQQQALDDLIRMHIVAGTALKTGVQKEPDVANALELTRLNLLTRAVIQKQLKDPPTEQELRAEYETYAAEQPKYEYHARHILVATEQFAQALIDRINKGASFAELAKKESMDGSKSDGGDLGWFSPTRMVKPFADAVVALQKGQVTQKPVQTQFGWHVIKLEDTRDNVVPDFEQKKEEIQQRVQEKKVQAYVDELKKTAKIEKKLT